MMTLLFQRPLARACIDCGIALPPVRRGFYCAEYGREGNVTPHALVSVVWSSRGRYWAVTVEPCPLCGKRHYHGGGDGPEPALGDRVAHCGEHDGSYELVETAESIAQRKAP
jgi:hypothetical protein